MTPDDALKAIRTGAYLSCGEPELRELLSGCLNISGPNPPYLHRAGQAAEIIQAELASRFLSGEATWLALQRTTQDLLRVAPPDHDVLILVGDIRVVTVSFIKPHSFVFDGFDGSGHQTSLILHFSRLEARVVYLPKCGPDRVVTGFGAAI
jgi:hypothetical protein